MNASKGGTQARSTRTDTPLPPRPPPPGLPLPPSPAGKLLLRADAPHHELPAKTARRHQPALDAQRAELHRAEPGSGRPRHAARHVHHLRGVWKQSVRQVAGLHAAGRAGGSAQGGLRPAPPRLAPSTKPSPPRPPQTHTTTPTTAAAPCLCAGSRCSSAAPGFHAPCRRRGLRGRCGARRWVAFVKTNQDRGQDQDQARSAAAREQPGCRGHAAATGWQSTFQSSTPPPPPPSPAAPPHTPEVAHSRFLSWK